MVITCEQCQARFRLADEKLKPEGTKVRCTKCKHVFTVFSPETLSAEETAVPTAFAPEPVSREEIPPNPPPLAPESSSFEAAPDQTVEPSPVVAVAPPAAPEMDLDFSGLEQSMGPGGGPGNLAEEFSFADTSTTADEVPPVEGSAPESGADTREEVVAADYAQGPGELDFDSTFAESEETPAVVTPETGPAEFAFDQDLAQEGGIDIAAEGATFDFATEAESSRPGEISAAVEPESGAPGEFDFSNEPATPATGGFDFGADESASGLSEFGFETEASAPGTAAPATVESASFEFGSGDSFESSAAPEEPAFGEAEPSWDQPEQKEGLSFDFDEPNFESKNQERVTKGRDEAGLSFGEIDFSDDVSEAPPSFGSEPDFSQAALAPAPEPEPLPVPPPPPAPRPETRRPHSTGAAPAPLRPRKRPLSRILGIAVLLLLLCGAGGYLYVTGVAQQFVASMLLKVKGEAPPAPMEQLITLNVAGSSYVKNREAGQLLVVQGTATNNFPNSRSAISVKGVLLDATGKVLQQQTVFCGNSLSEEKLRALKYAQIEETLSNQFGEGLSNMNVSTGKSLPFTIVFRNVPKEMANINVEVVDSKPGGS